MYQTNFTKLFLIYIFLKNLVFSEILLKPPQEENIKQSSPEDSHLIVKRSLLFQQFTILQLVAGITVPAILPNRTINLSLGIQNDFPLPFNLSQISTITVKRRKYNSYDIDKETFYLACVAFLNSYNFNGEMCLLRIICEIAEYPMHTEGYDVLWENIVHYLFTPSKDLPNKTLSKDSFKRKLLKAELNGVIKGRCDEIYKECEISFVDLFTAKYLN